MQPSDSSPKQPYQQFGKPERGLRERLYTVIFEADTRAGRWFDLSLIGAIVLSVTVVVLTSVAPVAQRHGELLNALEWFFTLLFTAQPNTWRACHVSGIRCVMPRVFSA